MKLRTFYIILMQVLFLSTAVAQKTWIAKRNGNWTSSSTWQTSGGASGAPSKTVNGTSIVIIPDNYTVTMNQDLILEGRAKLFIQNGGKLVMGNSGNPAPTFTMKDQNCEFHINDGTYESRNPGNGGNMLIEKGTIDWQDATIYVSGNYDFKSDVKDILMDNVCLRVAQNILYDGIASSSNRAVMTDVSKVSGLSGTGNLTIKGSSFINASNLKLNANSNTSNLELESSNITGSIYSIRGKQKLKIQGMQGNASLGYYCTNDLDGSLNAFSGSKTNNCQLASDVCTGPNPSSLPPSASDDVATTTINTPVDIDPLINDAAGSTPLVPSSITFVSATTPPASEGVFSVNNGVVTFTPALNFTGQSTISYSVCDQNGLCATATITVDIIPAIENLYPATGFGTLAYEDLWPAQGDYDFNDAVIDYQFLVKTNNLNNVMEVQATFILRAFGAGYSNGFGFQFNSNTLTDAQLTATGSELFENLVTLKANGFEANQNKPTIIVYDNTYKLMKHPGSGIGVNTTVGAPFVQPDTIVINIQFPNNVFSYNDLNIANFNPFIIVNQDRGREVHLANMAPTALANNSFFGTVDDDSNLGSGSTYVNENNLPWAINIVESFDYPKEKVQVTDAYLRFAQWAISAGAQFTNWFEDQPGNRNTNNIYQD